MHPSVSTAKLPIKHGPVNASLQRISTTRIVPECAPFK